jgi:SAM-dependent methyltransferase
MATCNVLPIERHTPPESTAQLVRMSDLVLPMAIRAASDLGVADRLVDGPQPVERLAHATGCHPPSLLRLLRCLASRGVFAEVEPGCFALSPLAELLRSDHPLSLRSVYTLLRPEIEAWAHADLSVRTGRAAFEQVHGETHASYLASHPEVRARIDRLQAAATRLDMLTILRAYRWGELRSVVDVGGGTGAFLAGLLARYPGMRGVLVDLPPVVEGAAEGLAEADVADRCTVVAGSFFDEIPPGADAYVLKAVLGGWDDDHARAILRSVRAAMGPRSRLLVLDPILDADAGFTVGNVLHLHSLVLVGGPDRTREEYDALLTATGFRISRVIARPTLPIIEARPGGTGWAP